MEDKAKGECLTGDGDRLINEADVGKGETIGLVDLKGEVPVCIGDRPLPRLVSHPHGDTGERRALHVDHYAVGVYRLGESR